MRDFDALHPKSAFLQLLQVLLKVSHTDWPVSGRFSLACYWLADSRVLLAWHPALIRLARLPARFWDFLSGRLIL